MSFSGVHEVFIIMLPFFPCASVGIVMNSVLVVPAGSRKFVCNTVGSSKVM